MSISKIPHQNKTKKILSTYAICDHAIDSPYHTFKDVNVESLKVMTLVLVSLFMRAKFGFCRYLWILPQ